MNTLSQSLAYALSAPVDELTTLQWVLSLLVTFVIGARTAMAACQWPAIALGIVAVAASARRKGPTYLAYGGVAARFGLSYTFAFALLGFEAAWNGRPFPSWLASPTGWAIFAGTLGALAWRRRRGEPGARGLALGLGILAAMAPTQCHPIPFPVILAYIAQTREPALGLALTLAYGLGLSTLPFLCAWFTGGLRRKQE